MFPDRGWLKALIVALWLWPATARGQDAGVAPDAGAEPSSADAGGESKIVDAGTDGEAAAPPAGTSVPSLSAALKERIKNAKTLASKLKDRVRALHGRRLLTDKQVSALEAQLNASIKLLGSVAERVEALAEKSEPAAEAALGIEIGAMTETLDGINELLDAAESPRGWNLVDKILEARCATAICFDNGAERYWLGIEPLVELPIGRSFAFGDSELTNYVNSHELRVDLAAGLRVWMFRDVVSVSAYISKPLSDDPVRMAGSPFVYPGTALKRPYPGVAIGLLFDSLWIGFDRDELRNGDAQDASALNPDYPPNHVVSSTWSVTFALQPVTAFRTAVGTAVQSAKDNK